MKNKFFVGFDTSNYTTSAAVCDADGEVLLNVKVPLSVKDGARGLRQSDAVFGHTQNMPAISAALKKFFEERADYEISSVGYSAYPRDISGSYMPCFLVGRSVAAASSALLGAAVYPFSHQAGHIMAALYSSHSLGLCQKNFFAFHVSGGTTDILRVSGFENGRFTAERVGGTLDLNAGQVIDRVGVYMGLPFPAGREMEKLALNHMGKIPRYTQSVHALSCNLSGVENKAKALFDSTKNPSLVSAYTLRAVCDALCILSENLIKIHGESPIVYAGGVMSCSILKERLSAFSERFAAPEFSSDNAAGISLLARSAYLTDNSGG